MSAVNRAHAITRWGAVALMATAVMTATAGGFAQSYAGLYHWALDHGLKGWKAESFPLLVDLFIIVGELGLFLLAIDAFVIHRRHLLSWLDFCLPLTIALAGWTASLIFNVGHVGHREFSYQATAAVPPIVSMLGLFVLLRTLHRYVSQNEQEETKPAPAELPQRAVAPVTLQQITLMPLRVTGPIPQVPARPETAIESGTTAARTAKAAAPAAPPAPKAPAPEPAAAAPELAVVGAAARPGVNGHGALETSALDDPIAAPPEPALRLTSPETLRNVVQEVLERHRGDIAATLAEVTADGYRCDVAEVRRIRENHWFPYVVYRLLAKHSNDGDQVGRALSERGIDYDRAALDELVRSWNL